MRSILKAFANGNLNTSPRFISDNPKLSQAMEIGSKAEEELLSMLDDGIKKTLEQFTYVQMDINALSCTDHFIYGYRLDVL